MSFGKIISERFEGTTSEDGLRSGRMITKYDRDGKIYTHVESINEEKSLTQQQYKNDCDVNLIIAKYEQTGTLHHVDNAKRGVYMDLTQAPSFEESLKVVMQAQNAFDEIPAQIRQRFGHDPQQFIDFLADEANTEEAIKLGLRSRPTSPPPDPILATLSNIEKNTQPKPKSQTKTQPS